MGKMFDDFKAFISRGNIFDLAIGVVIGASFTAIVNSLVDDVIMPVIGAFIGGIHIEGLSFTMGDSVIAYGNFLNAILSFLIIALALFFFIRGMNAAEEELEDMGILEDDDLPEPPKEPVLTLEEQLLSEIRDMLKDNLVTTGD